RKKPKSKSQGQSQPKSTPTKSKSKQQYLDEMKTLINKEDYRNGEIDIEIKINELKGNFNRMSIEINKKKELRQLEQVANLNTYPSWHFNSFCYKDDDDDDDEEYTIAITPDLPTKEPDNSLSMGDEHLSTFSETELDEVIKTSVEDLFPIPSESEGISDDTCDVPFCDNSPPLDVLNDHFDIFSDFNDGDDYTSSDEDSFENLDYVEASPPDSKLVSLEEVKDDILREKLLNINLLIA
ncbi:hypothetical protein Tco_0131811, partial [Tanacetum coccineum]